VNDPVGQARIDPVGRLAILAAALPGAAVRQRRIAAPFDAVWHVVADLEHATPRYEPSVARLHVTSRHGQHLQLVVERADGREETMQARLRPGWCLMQSATTVVAFAARQLDNSQTLLAHLEHRRVPGRLPGPGRPPGRRSWLARIDEELRVIERLATEDRR
jgi:hypothetical protein